MSLRSSLCVALIFMGSLALGGCVASGTDSILTGSISQAPQRSLYGPRPEEAHPLPATNVSGVNARYLRQTVNFRRPEAPGTIVVDTNNRFLYLVQSNGRALESVNT